MLNMTDGLEERIGLSRQEIEAFCRRWKIAELSLFGSVLRDDFGPDSDIDFLAKFDPDAQWSLLDRADMQIELSDRLHRKVDLLNRHGVEQSRNRFRRIEILKTARPLYVAPRQVGS